MKKIIVFAFFLFLNTAVWSQYSIATDITVLRNFSKGQHFFALGQTVQVNFHLSKRESIYTSICYYTNGRFKNNLTAIAKDMSVVPITVAYTAHSVIRYRQVSLGWKHFIRGAYDNEQTWNLYGLAGFGIVPGRVDNTFEQAPDPARYNPAQGVIAGSAAFKRLTFDVGLGGEIILGTGIYLYSEVRTWLPASDYPSPYLYNNTLPQVAVLSGGIRILID